MTVLVGKSLDEYDCYAILLVFVLIIISMHLLNDNDNRQIKTTVSVNFSHAGKKVKGVSSQEKK